MILLNYDNFDFNIEIKMILLNYDNFDFNIKEDFPA